MELTTKPDLEECLDRVEAWWNCQVIDRPPVTISVKPDRPGRQVPSHHASLRDRWMDADYAVERMAAAVETGVYLAESFPKFYPNLGPEICATAYGAELDFTEGSSWSRPVLGGIHDALKLRPNLDNPYWRMIRQQTALSLERGRGKWFTGVTDLHTQGDLLAALRDPQNFALDFMDDFDGVVAACRHVTPHFADFFEDSWRQITAAQPGTPGSTWGCCIARGRMYYASCDFICMISPAMFRRTILPAIEWELTQLDRAIFHLDGPGALKHLDDLLALPRLGAIQWTYGAGQGTAKDWIPVYQRIQAAGKGMEVHAADMADARTMLEHLRPEGVWLNLFGSYTRAEAEAFLNGLSRRRR